MKKVLIFDGEKCVACKICELVCSVNVIGEYNPKRAFIKILSNQEFCVHIPVLDIGCKECEKCAEACPTQALKFVQLNEAALLRKKGKIGVFPVPIIRGEK